ncbi:PAS domain S-box protein [Thiobacillus sp.]|uniref:sensor histidine kinase n=1 Tax=Thiobacillus sp. TaxID=924 RepID=UPI0025F64C9C|nr:PAS domain S-box protein [Thiobacillus sp.]MBT9539372.1 PAS domain S-box protein [Thiobacillus sp.]
MRRILQIVHAARSIFSSDRHAGHEDVALLHAIYDSAPIGITLTDLHGRFVRTNPAFQRMTGFSASELSAETCESLTHPEDFPRYRGLREELLEGQRAAFRLVMRHRTKTGAAAWIRSTVSLLNGRQGVPLYLVARSEDVTESWQRRTRQHERTESFHLLVASVTDYAIFILDPEGRVTSWNAGAERIKGYLADEIIGQHFSCFYQREDIEQGNPAHDLQAALIHGRYEDESWRLRKDGSAFWANVIITPMRDESGALRGFAQVTRDLTVRRQLEERLRESEARLQAFLNHSPAVIFLKDVEGRYLHANAKFKQRFRLNTEQVIGRTDAELFAPEQAATFRANDQQVMTSGVPMEFEETAQYEDGLCISVVSKFPVRDTAGRIIGIGGIATDMTVYKRVQEALRISEQGFRELVDILPIAVYTCDASGLIEGHNRQATELWGREPSLGDEADRFCGAYRLYTHDGVYMPYPDCPMGEVLRTGRAVVDREIIIERPDGSRRAAVVNIIPRLDEHGAMTGAINCLIDITERKLAEHELKMYADQLRVLSSRLVELHEESRLSLSRELHDRVGQNLSALNINLGIVLSQLPDAAKYQVGARLKDSQGLVEATVDVITDVMADLRPPLLDDYGLLPALKSIAEQFSRRMGIGVEVRCPAHLDGLTKQVELSLYRIAQEAMTNLAKHAHARNVKIEVALPPDQVTLTISDDGIGFDPNMQPQYSGRVGWGMLTMRERAVALGGTLAIDSKPGVGTRVTVTLTRKP